jgi:transporter family-2 protein
VGAWPFVLLAALAGIAQSLQIPINGRLRIAVGSPFASAVVSYAAGLVCTASALALSVRFDRTARLDFSRAAWWMYAGGLAGAVYVLSSIVTVTRLGAAGLIALAVVGQMVGALVIDHNGWFGVPVQPAGFHRWVGVLLVLGGVSLFFRR